MSPWCLLAWLEASFHRSGTSRTAVMWWPDSRKRHANCHCSPTPAVCAEVFRGFSTTALPDLDLRCADVLIRADAGSDLPPIQTDALKERDNNPAKPLLVIDCHDKQHPALRRLSRLRQQAYQRRGWLAPYADPEQARVDAFLAARPRRPTS
jgi:hypothetical protein